MKLCAYLPDSCYMNAFSSFPNILTFVAMSGVFQGMVLFLLLWQRRKNKSNLYLAFFILIFSVNIGLYSDPTFEIYIRHPYPALFFDFIPYLQGPLMYFYFFYSFYRDRSPRIPFWIHTVPAICSILIMNGFYLIMGVEYIRDVVKQTILRSPHIIISTTNACKFVSGVFYAGLIVNLVKSNSTNLREWMKNKRQRNWLILLAMTNIICWIIVVATGIVIHKFPMQQDIIKIFVQVELISWIIAMYLIVFFSIRYPTLFSKEHVRDKIAEKLNLDEKAINLLIHALNNIMGNEKLFLDEAISLREIAKRLAIHPNTLSFILNEKFHKNFKEYINELRLAYFLQLVKTGKETTILRLALDSGFASKTTFNRVFKKHFKKTPQAYLQSISELETDT